MEDNKIFSEDDMGFTAVLERMKGGKHTLASLLSTFQERSAMEDEFAKRLLKSAKNAPGKDETPGSMANALQGFGGILEARSKIHSILSSNIKTLLEKPLDALIEEQRKIRKNHQNNVEKTYRNKISQLQFVRKVDEKVKKMAQEADAFSKLKGTKEEIKFLKATQVLTQGKIELHGAIDKLNDLHLLWVKNYDEAVEQFRFLEEARIEAMKSFMKIYAEIVTDALGRDIETINSLTPMFNSCDAKAAISDMRKNSREEESEKHYKLTSNNVKTSQIPVSANLESSANSNPFFDQSNPETVSTNPFL